MTRRILALWLLIGNVPTLTAADKGSNTTGESNGAAGDGSANHSPEASPTPDPAAIIPQPTVKPYSDRETRAACQKYEGRYISYYGDVYHVERCKRRPILSHIAISTLAKKKIHIIPVEAGPVAALPEGEPLEDTVHSVTKRNCRELAGRYVTFSFNEIFYVEKCKKRLFPDWASYLNHRSRANAKQREILGLTWEEFEAIPIGDDFPSSMDQEYAKMRERDKPMVILPIKEACKGVEGKVLTFHSKMYLIENCKKREIDPEKFTRSRGRAGFKVSEMTAEQWFSLPDGKPKAI